MTKSSSWVETRPDQQGQRLSIIFEIAKALVMEYDVETLLPNSLASLVKNLETADTGVLMLYDPNTEHLTVGAAQGYETTILRQIQLKVGEGINGSVLKAEQARLYPTPESLADAQKNLSDKNRAWLQKAEENEKLTLSAVCIPLLTAQTKVGTLFLGNRSRTHAFSEEDLPFLRALTDLTALSIENIYLRQELQEVQALEEANRLKSELISTLAHEMRTPLTSIKGYSTALLMEEATFDLETQAEFLKIIDEECDTLQDLIHDLLESSIIDAGLLKLEFQPVRLSRLVQTVVEDMGHRTDKHQFVVDVPDELPIIDADPKRIEQVLRNLLDNAVKYSPGGGLIVVRGERREDEIIVSVADQGVGLAPEHLNRLFEKFFRVESGLGYRVVGSGLGLPISRTIVESHGGRIWAESREGEGTTLYFTLPIHTHEEANV